MIPKKIHFFHNHIDIIHDCRGAFLGDRICINSWYTHCDDYEIIHWHDKLPEFQKMLKSSRFLRDCYKRKIWAMVSDYVRVYAIYHYGGIYLDTDVQIVSSLEPFLVEHTFFLFEYIRGDYSIICPGLFGSEPGTEIVKMILDAYNSDILYREPMTSSPDIATKFFMECYKDREPFQLTKDSSGAPAYPWILQVEKGQTFRTHDKKITVFPSNLLVAFWVPDRKLLPSFVAVHWGGRGVHSWLAPGPMSFLENKHKKLAFIYQPFTYLYYAFKRFRSQCFDKLKQILKRNSVLYKKLKKFYLHRKNKGKTA